MSKLNIFSTLALVVFCFAIGESLAVLFTSFIYSRSINEVLTIVSAPTESGRSLVMCYSMSSSLLRFMIVPGLYLFIVNKNSLDFLWNKSKIKMLSLGLSILLAVSILPFISLVAELNSSILLPSWASEAETYFKANERQRQQITDVLFTFTSPSDFILVILIGAIIPGIVEELFFRGVIQTQLQARLISHHNAIFFSAFIFSVLHFQFYGLLPRMIMGLILGYMFYWSKNIWYPVLVHIVNNTIGVIGIYFLGTTILEPYNKSLLTLLFVVISFVLSVFIILHLKRIFYFRRR